MTNGNTNKILNGHFSNINAFKLINNSILISGDQVGTVLAWNLNTSNILFNISNSNCITNAIEVINENIIVGLNTAPYIRIYNFNGNLIKSTTTTDVNSIVKALERLENDELASGSNNGIITIFYKNFTKKNELNGISTVNCLKFMGNQILASGFSTNIKIWNISNGSLITTLTKNITSNINALEILNNGNLASASSFNGILTWNTKTCIKIFLLIFLTGF